MAKWRKLLLPAALIAAWLPGVGAGMADGSFPDVQLTPSTPEVQHTSDRICRELNRAKFPVGECPKVWISPNLGEALAPDSPKSVQVRIVGLASSSGTVLTPDNETLPFGPSIPEVNSVLLHTHELLHRTYTARPTGEIDEWGRKRLNIWDYTPEDQYWDESLTEAVAIDVLPMIFRRVWGRGWVPRFDTRVYPEGVSHVRGLSVRATGSPWRSRRARSWRAWVLKSPPAVRRAAIADAINNRKEP